MTNTETAEYETIDRQWTIASALEAIRPVAVAELMGDLKISEAHANVLVTQAVREIRAGAAIDLATAVKRMEHWEFNAEGDPQAYPFDAESSATVQRWIDAGRPATGELAARVAGIKGTREAWRSGHTPACRGDLYRGLCH